MSRTATIVAVSLVTLVVLGTGVFLLRGRDETLAAGDKPLPKSSTTVTEVGNATSLPAKKPIFDPEADRARRALVMPGVKVLGTGLSFRQPIAHTLDYSSIVWFDAAPGGTCVVNNGERGDSFTFGSWDERSPIAQLSADGKIVAHVASTSGNSACVIFNGKPGTPYKRIASDTLAISPDGMHIAYAAVKDQYDFTMVIDGAESGKFYRVGQVLWSPDSKRLAYAATDRQPDNGKGFNIFVDGVRHVANFRWVGDRFAQQPPIVFSADSKRWAARGQVFGPNEPGIGGVGGYAVMADGKLHPTYGDIVRDTLCFSPDSSTLFYAAGYPTGDYFLYTEGTPGKRWNYILPGSIQFGNGGKSVAMMACTGKREGNLMASDPTEGRKGWTPGLPSLVINDTIMGSYPRAYALSPVSERFVYAQNITPDIYAYPRRSILIDGSNSPVELPDDCRIEKLQFSSDGKHWAAILFPDSAPRLLYDGKIYAGIPQLPTAYFKFQPDGTLRSVVFQPTRIWHLELVPAELLEAPNLGSTTRRTGSRSTTMGTTQPTATQAITRPTTRPSAKKLLY